MANRFPLIIDTENGNRISELPAGDNLDLTGSGIINAASVSVNGSITTSSIIINGQSLSAVAFSNNFEDLDNVPVGFSGDYDDLINKPTPVLSTWDLNDIQGVVPNNGDILRYNTLNSQWEPEELVQDFDLSNRTLQDIGNVITTGDITNKYLKYYAGAWRAAGVTYAEVQNAPTKLSQLINDVGYITTQGEDSQTLSFDGNNLTISNGNTVDITQTISYDGSSLSLSNSNTVDTGGLDAIFRTLRTVEGYTGDVTGSVFADDSSLLVDGVNGTIPGYVSIAELKNIAATSATYANFQAAIAAL